MINDVAGQEWPRGIVKLLGAYEDAYITGGNFTEHSETLSRISSGTLCGTRFSDARKRVDAACSQGIRAICAADGSSHAR
jgi:hypothetical protein